MVSHRRLGDLAELGCKQGYIDLPRQAFEIDDEVDQGIERAHRAEVAGFGSESTVKNPRSLV
jgi:hypothetical protein